MQSNTIQAMLAANADRISDFATKIAFHQEQASWRKQKGESELMTAEYKQVNRNRRKLVEAVALQRTMKTELIHLHRVARIARNTLLLATVGVTYVAPSFATSVAIEAEQAALIELHVPKKPDSRLLKKAA